MVLQEPIQIDGRTFWVHRFVLSVRDRKVLGVVRRGNLCPHLLSEALGPLLDEVISDLFEIKIMKLLSKPTLHWVLGRNPDLMRHFCLDKVIDLDPPVMFLSIIFRLPLVLMSPLRGMVYCASWSYPV